MGQEGRSDAGRLRLIGALALAAALVGCGSAPRQGGVWAPLPPAETSGSVPPSEATAPAGRLSPEQAVDVTLYALGLVGTPYRWGGNTPESGFDCSGLIDHVYLSRAQIKLPRTTAELAFVGQSVEARQLRTGDLVLFGPGTLPNHAGIYVGQGRFVHAPSTGGTVRQDRLDARHWQAQRPRYRRP